MCQRGGCDGEPVERLRIDAGRQTVRRTVCERCVRWYFERYRNEDDCRVIREAGVIR